MTARAALVLAGIALIVAGLAGYRSLGRGGSPAGTAAPPSPAPRAASLPQVLDFGRDT